MLLTERGRKGPEEQRGSTAHPPGPLRALNAVLSRVEAPGSGAPSEGKACAPGPQALLLGSSVCREVFKVFLGYFLGWGHLKSFK